MGHFLSYIQPERLVRGLRRVELRHRSEYAAEGRALERWLKRGLDACARPVGGNGSGTGETGAAGAQPREIIVRSDAQLAGSLAVVWSYEDQGRLTFNFDFEHGTAVLESTLDCEPNRVGATVKLLPPDKALAEVLFF